MNRFNDQRRLQLLDGSYNEKLILDWRNGEPNNGRGKEYCAHVIATTSQLNDADCSETVLYTGSKTLRAPAYGLCERKYVQID